MRSASGAEQAVGRWLAREQRLPGFGHPLYPDGDPRARRASGRFRRRSDVDGAPRGRGGGDRRLPNVDFALAAVTSTLRLPRDAAFRLFALGRSVGWAAHAMEQAPAASSSGHGRSMAGASVSRRPAFGWLATLREQGERKWELALEGAKQRGPADERLRRVPPHERGRTRRGSAAHPRSSRAVADCSLIRQFMLPILSLPHCEWLRISRDQLSGPGPLPILPFSEGSPGARREPRSFCHLPSRPARDRSLSNTSDLDELESVDPGSRPGLGRPACETRTDFD